MPEFIFVGNHMVNADELLYVKNVKKGTLYVCVFKDEQTVFLDSETGYDLMNKLKKYNKKKAI